MAGIVDGITGWFQTAIGGVLDFFKKMFEFFTVYVVGLITAIATLIVAFIAQLPTLFTSMIEAISKLGSAANAWQPVDVSGWWAGGPGYSLSAINALVPLQELLSAFIVYVSLMTLAYSITVARFFRKMFLWFKQMVAEWL